MASQSCRKLLHDDTEMDAGSPVSAFHYPPHHQEESPPLDCESKIVPHEGSPSLASNHPTTFLNKKLTRLNPLERALHLGASHTTKVVKLFGVDMKEEASMLPLKEEASMFGVDISFYASFKRST